MKAIILAAGYATRLQHLTHTTPKPLLPVNGSNVLEHIISKISTIKDLNEITIVSNQKFYQQFVNWNNNYDSEIPINILNDGSTTNDNRLGAIKDISFALEKEDNGNQYLVIAADNIIEHDFNKFYDEFKSNNYNLIAALDIKNKDLVRNKHGVVVLNENNKVIDFQEKPDVPRSTTKSICCYLFQPGIKPLINQYLEENNPDATGFFIEWLHKQTEVHAHLFQGRVHDIGNPESYKQAQELFKF